jgi:hypothetical protein
VTYTIRNFRTKKALKEAVAAGENIECYEPGIGTVPAQGQVYLEGPHYPQPHKWYATATLTNGKVTKVK